MWGTHNEECRQPLEAESSCWLTDNKKNMTSVPQAQGDEFWKQPVGLKENSKPSPWFHLGGTLSRECRHPNPDLWSAELWDKKWVLLEATKFAVICSAAIEGKCTQVSKSVVRLLSGPQRLHWQEVRVGWGPASERCCELRKSMPIYEWIRIWWGREHSAVDRVLGRKQEVQAPTPSSATASLHDPGKVTWHLFIAVLSSVLSSARCRCSTRSHPQGYTWNSSNGSNSHLSCGQFWRNIRDSSVT